MDLLFTITYCLVLALGAWVILASVRHLSPRKYYVVASSVSALLLIYIFVPVEGLPVIIFSSALFLYPVAYFHNRILVTSGQPRKTSVKTLLRTVTISILCSALILILALSYFASLKSLPILHAVSYGLVAFMAALLAWRTFKGGALDSVANSVSIASLEEKVLCNYSAEYMGWVSSSHNNDAIFSRVELFFKSEEMPFCKSDLLLADVAKSVLTNKVYLSRAIHSKTGLNFCQYVNKFRVEYAKELYIKNPTLHVNELATMSGFSTMTTFCSAFRAIEGMSPGDWTRVYIQHIKNKTQ